MGSIRPLPWPSIDQRPLLGANGTEAMQVLLSRGTDGLVDYLKVGPFMGREAIAALSQDCPLMLHLDDTLSGHGELPPQATQGILDWIELTGTPWTSEHIGFNVAEATLREALTPLPAERALSRELALCNIVRNARALARQLPVPIILENVPLFPNRAHLNITEPEFISEVIAQVDCGFLLDLAHAQATAQLLGCEPQEYLMQLPLERVVELHLGGPRHLRELSPERQVWINDNARSVSGILHVDGDTLIDVHEALREVDYDLFAWVLGQVRPQAVSLEYYREVDPLRLQLERLGEMLVR